MALAPELAVQTLAEGFAKDASGGLELRRTLFGVRLPKTAHFEGDLVAPSHSTRRG
jgi:hypothetical protein